MSTRLPMELRVAGWMADEADDRAPDALVAAVLERTADAAQRPQVVALVLERPLRIRQELLVGSPTLRLGLVVAALLLAALAVVGGAVLLRPPPPDDWLGFRGGADHVGVGLSGPVGHPVERWRFDAGAPVSGNLVLTGDLVLAPSDDGVLYALDVATGTERWRWSPGVTVTGPTVADGTAYLSDGTGFVHALDVATGTERWRSPLGVTGASVVAAGTDTLYLGTGDGFVVALDRSDGVERWRSRATPGSGAVMAPALGGDLVVAATDDGTLAAIRADSGELSWRVDGLSPGLGTAVIAGGLVFIGPQGGVEGGALTAVGLADGKERWHLDEPLFSPSVAGQLAINGSNVGVVTGRDLLTGDERWRVRLDGTNRAPAIAGSLAYVAADGLQQVVALDLAKGGELWRFDVDGSNGCCIAAARGLLFFGTDTGSVYALEGDGAPLTPAPASGAQAPAPSATATATATDAPATSGPTASPTPAPATDVLAVRARFPAADLGLDRPIALAVAPTGDIYVTDASNHVTRISPDGMVRKRWGGSGTTPGRFDFIPAQTSANIQGSITVGPDGKVYVADSDNHRIQVFAPDGGFIRAFGSIDAAVGALIAPFDLGVDAGGNVYVADDAAHRMSKFGPAGGYLWTVDGDDDKALDGHLHGLVNDPAGNLVAVNDDTGFAIVLDTDGVVLETFRTGGCTPSIDAAGHLWVSACLWGDVRVFDTEHRLIGISAGLGIGPPQFGPNGEVAALDTDGAIVLLTVDLP